MSKYKITNRTNGRSNTFPNTFSPGSSSISGYKQGGAPITFSSLVNSTIESVITNYKYQGTDIGNSFCAIYNQGSATIPIANYSNMSIIMCGGGGGGGGGGGAGHRSNGPKTGGDAGAGADGGITVVRSFPISAYNSVTISVGTAGNAGQGGLNSQFNNSGINNAPSGADGNAGGSGNATTVAISGGPSFTANGGGGGNGGQGGTPNTNGGNGTAGGAGGVTSNSPYTAYNDGTSYVNISSINITNRDLVSGGITYCNGGSGGAGANQAPGNTNYGTDGNAGNAGFCRIYLYP
uniref:Uncharacterized protein n=1 Tax=viral metagenome TaxID=1070528 RepID=A0A6C0HC15_9ZZZZ